MTDARKALESAREALATIERASSEVSRLGAQAGPQWPKLTSALISSRAALAAIDAALASGEQGWRTMEGYVLLPRELTPEMIGAWYRIKNGHHFHGEPPPTNTSDYAAYRAMIAAAPPAPETRS